MYKSITIATEQEEFKVSALIISKGKEPLKFDFPSFDILIDGAVVESWDSVPYLIEEVYPYLKGEREDEDLDDKLSFFKEELLEVFEEAFHLGILKQ